MSETCAGFLPFTLGTPLLAILHPVYFPAFLDVTHLFAQVTAAPRRRDEVAVLISLRSRGLQNNPLN